MLCLSNKKVYKMFIINLSLCDFKQFFFGQMAFRRMKIQRNMNAVALYIFVQLQLFQKTVQLHRMAHFIRINGIISGPDALATPTRTMFSL